MPVEHHIADDASITTVQVSGSVVPDELQAGVEALIADPGYDPALPLLVDLRGMEIELDCRALEPFNGFVIEHLGLSRAASMAVVIDNDLESELCAAIYWLSCAVYGTELFEDYDLAIKWLFRRDLARTGSASH